jgi:hypothetical protein
MSKQTWSEARISPTKLGAMLPSDCCSPVCYWRFLRLRFQANLPLDARRRINRHRALINRKDSNVKASMERNVC